MSVVVCTALTKRYGDIDALHELTIAVEEGEVLGFLGPNGAGKTTSLRMLLGLIRPTSGAARLFGRDPLVDGARALDGVAGFVEGPRFYPYMSGRRNLQLLADYDGDGARKRIDEVLRLVELQDRAKHRVGGYSHGMRQRLGIAASLLRDPRMLLLDEPATGLDPAGMRDMRALVRRLADEGITVLLSSHLLAEVEELCNRVAIIRRGRIVYEGSLAALLTTAGEQYRLRAIEPERAQVVCLSHPGLEDVQRDGDEIVFRASQDVVAGLSIALGQARVGFTALAPRSTSLEELFLGMTEGQPDEEPAAEAVA